MSVDLVLVVCIDCLNKEPHGQVSEDMMIATGCLDSEMVSIPTLGWQNVGFEFGFLFVCCSFTP